MNTSDRPGSRVRIIAAVVLAIVLAIWFFSSRLSDSTPSQVVEAPNQVAFTTALQKDTRGAGMQSVPTQHIGDASADLPFAEVRPELERRALAGDGAAARRLGMALANCNQYKPASAQELEDFVVEQSAQGMTLSDGRRTLSPEEILAKFKLAVAQRDRMCRGVSGLDDDDALKHAFEWIERGAALGDADAQAAYSSLAFSSYPLRTALAHAEEIRERKALAIKYLENSLSQGDGLALLQLSYHYKTGDLYPQSDERAYAYLYALSLTDRAAEFEPELLQQNLAASSESLDAEARERAEREGRQLATCCAPLAGAP